MRTEVGRVSWHGLAMLLLYFSMAKGKITGEISSRLDGYGEMVIIMTM